MDSHAAQSRSTWLRANYPALLWLVLCLMTFFTLVGRRYPASSATAAPANTPPPTYQWQLFNYVGFGVYWVAFSPTYTTDQTIYIATGNGVHRSTDRGASWQPFNTGLPNVQRLDFSPAYATDHLLFVGTVAGIYSSANDGQSWTNLGLSNEVITGMAISPDFATDRSLFVGMGSGRVYRSTNGGGAWQASGSLYLDYSIRGLVISPNFVNDATVFAGVGKGDQWFNGGVYRSVNGGQTWQAVNNGLTYQEVGALAISPNYASDQTLLVTVWSGGVFRSTDKGDSWVQVNNNQPNRRLSALAFSTNYTNDALVALGTWGEQANGGVYLSTDGGTNWVYRSDGLTNRWIHQLVFSPNYASDSVLLAGGEQTNGGGLWIFAPPSATPTPTASPTLSPTPTATDTSTATPTATPTPTTTPTVTPTITPTPPPGSDAYEIDDTCAQARTTAADGAIQAHFFHQAADADWVHFNTTAGTSYLVEVQIPPDSPADVALELYPDCTGVPSQNQDPVFSPGVRLEFVAVNTGPVYLRLTNHDPTLFGAHVTYQLSVRALNAAPAPGALILVAGRLRVNDALQPNIDQVANRVYQLFQNQGYGEDRIFYLHSDLSQPGVDATASVDNLRNAITAWAADKVDANHALTLYLVDHGAEERFYLDKPAGQWLAPDELDAWLSTLESGVLGVKVNVIVEACHSGSFIGAPLTISKVGRVIVTSTNIQNDAYASDVGAVFSDHFLTALGQGGSLSTSFASGRWAAAAARSWQEAWLDGDGDGLPNEAEDEAVAALRGFTYAGSLADDAWPPYIAKAHGPDGVANRRGVIQATVYDDIRVRRVWAVIYAPSYALPASGEALVQEALPTIVLQSQGNDVYAAEYTGFDEAGTYRIVLYAEDDDGIEARPRAVAVRVTGGQLYLPLVMR